jgi:Zn-dependent M16 (insulinase) family peptidase
LFPDNSYGVDSGGDPEKIPDLTFEQFSQFHQTCYHPSNARIFFYGDDDPVKRLDLLEEYLKDFDRLDVDTSIALQPAFDAPRRKTYPYAAGEDAAAEAKSVSHCQLVVA